MSSKLICSQLLLLIAVLITACSNDNGLPKGWTKDVPGRFEGVSPPYREVLEFHTDGTFSHEGYNGSNQLFTESGDWRASSNEFEIDIKPNTEFTELYNPRSRSFSSAGQKFTGYMYWPAWPVPEGTPFSIISASADYEFSLKRQPSR